jgi:hypothetical protein
MALRKQIQRVFGEHGFKVKVTGNVMLLIDIYFHSDSIVISVMKTSYRMGGGRAFFGFQKMCKAFQGKDHVV